MELFQNSFVAGLLLLGFSAVVFMLFKSLIGKYLHMSKLPATYDNSVSEGQRTALAGLAWYARTEDDASKLMANARALADEEKETCIHCGNEWYRIHYKDGVCHSCQQVKYPPNYGRSEIRRSEQYVLKAKASIPTAIAIVCIILFFNLGGMAAAIGWFAAGYYFFKKTIIDVARFHRPYDPPQTD